MRRRVVNLGTLDFGSEHPMTGIRVERLSEEKGVVEVRLLENLGIFRIGDVVTVKEGEFRRDDT